MSNEVEEESGQVRDPICTQNTHFVPISTLICTQMKHFVLKPSSLSYKKHGFRTCEFATVTRLYNSEAQV